MSGRQDPFHYHAADRVRSPDQLSRFGTVSSDEVSAHADVRVCSNLKTFDAQVQRLPVVIEPPTDYAAAELALVDAARSALRTGGDGEIHTVAAAVLDENARIHVGLNL